MKCPKCNYLGFETGDRCKNCGYDFSLMAKADSDPTEVDLDLRLSDEAETIDWLADVDPTTPPAWSDLPAIQLRPERGPEPELPVPEPPSSRGTAEPKKLPLFTPKSNRDGDEPLIKLPPTPRAPLAVRRAPAAPRFRAMATPVQRVEPVPTPYLQFDAEGERTAAPPPVQQRTSRVWKEPRVPPARITGKVSGRGARALAAAIDHVLLGGIDLAVVYFTVRMAGLPVDDWTALPPVPLLAFLLLIKLSYFCAFTAVGGQTIGKMAARIRVVSADDHPLDAAAALRRTLAGALSAVLFGLGFLPALFRSDRRALHDRVARTRVIALPST